MSSVFKQPKTVYLPDTTEVLPEEVDDNEIIFQLEKKRKKRMGAISQMLAKENDSIAGKKQTLGE